MVNRNQLLLAPARRVTALVAALAAFAVVIGLGMLVADQTHAGTFDRPVDDWFTGHVDYRTALWFADLGNGPVVAVVAAALVVLCLIARRPRGAVLAVLAPLCASAVTEWVLKPLVHRTKVGALAYPSGHATGWCAVAFVLILLVIVPGRRALSRWASMMVVVVALLLSVLCALGLIAADYHYATDVIGGICVAAATVLTLALAIDAVRPGSGSPTGRGTTDGTASSADTPHRPIHPSRSSRR